MTYPGLNLFPGSATFPMGSAAGEPVGGVQILIEFGTAFSNVWTDVSQWFDSSQDITVQYGRTSEYAAPTTAALSFILDNTDGRFTPDRQLLQDNATTHPYYPNVELRKRVQVNYTTAVSSYSLFTGFIKGWVPIVDPNGGFKTRVSAATREDKLSNTPLLTPAQQETLTDSPVAFWPLNDLSASTIAVDSIGANNLSVVSNGPGGAITFAQAGVSASEDTACNFAPASLVGGYCLAQPSAKFPSAAATSTTPIGYGVECWFQTSVLPGVSGYNMWSLASVPSAGSLPNYDEIGMASDGSVSFSAGGSAVNAPSNYCDGAWHYVYAEHLQTASTTTINLYIDGALVGTTSCLASSYVGGSCFVVGSLYSTGNPKYIFDGSMALVAVYSNTTGTALLSPTRVATHYKAALGFVGDTTGQRVARYLSYGGVTSSQYNIDTCVGIVGPYATSGQSVMQACQAMADTEGGGSCIYQTPDGNMRFTSRNFQIPGAPVLTFDAAADLDGPSFTPTKDDSDVVNQSTATQAAGSGTGASYTAKNTDSIALYGLIGDQVTSYATTMQDVINLAQSHIAAGWHPVRDTHAKRSKGRLQSVTLDVYTSQTAGLYDLLSSVQIGSRIRIVNLPSHFPTSQIDVIVEGWTVNVNVDKFSIAWVTSSADNPARMVWSDPSYGRWGPDPGSMTTALASASTSTVVVTTAGSSPTFSTAAGDYPLYIQVGEEVIELPTAPSGASSPQTFTGALRGQKGTVAAPQSAASPVNLWPSPTWTL
uniref:Concanavalin A-like lectin/glucanases superfamily n=1 Tax=uncultured organism TaxID=155900 RepID=A0A7L9QBU9_9ZZZZ|nr:hypothetical protein [uncultured organism]